MGIDVNSVESFVTYLDHNKMPHPVESEEYVVHWANGNIEKVQYYKPNSAELHRTDGPALIHFNLDGTINYKMWYLHGKVTKCDGPAIVQWYRDEDILALSYEWYKDSERLTDEQSDLLESFESGSPEWEFTWEMM